MLNERKKNREFDEINNTDYHQQKGLKILGDKRRLE